MTIKEIQNKKEWEGFLESIQEKTFLQSWNWGEFQKENKKKFWRLGLYEDGHLRAVGLVIKNPIFTFGRYQKNFLFCPHGPLVASPEAQERIRLLKIFLDYLKNLARKEKVAFIRLAPFWPDEPSLRKAMRSLGCRPAPMFIHPELTWELNLESSEEAFLKAMRKTTRYLIKKGLTWPGLEIKKGINAEDLEIFQKLYQKTTKRHHFVPFPLSYLKKEIQVFQKDKEILIFSALLQDKALASAIIVFWQGIAFYHHGASINSQRVPAAYLLQWKIIQEAKKRGCHLYNFWGITSSTDKKHPWWGLTLFKKGFGGEAHAYLKTQDFILSKIYWFNWLIEVLRRLKRKL